MSVKSLFLLDVEFRATGTCGILIRSGTGICMDMNKKFRRSAFSLFLRVFLWLVPARDVFAFWKMREWVCSIPTGDRVWGRVDCSVLGSIINPDYLLIRNALCFLMSKKENSLDLDSRKSLANMLEALSYLVMRHLPSSCQEESRWVYNTFRVLEHSKQLDDADEFSLTKFSRPLDTHYRWDTMQGARDRSVSKAARLGDKHQAGEKEDSSSLVHQIGRDNSINCLLRCSRSDYGSLAAVNRSFRSLIKSGELYRLRRQMGIVEHWVYFSCNHVEWDAFDPIRSRWLHLPKMSTDECFASTDKESLAVGTELLVFGREIMSHIIYKYSLLTNTWTSGMEMNVPRCLFGSASLGEIGILAGGCDPRGNVLSSAELYNSDTGRWEMLPDMHKARKMCSGVFMDGKFYVIGGIGPGNMKSLTCGEVYDMETRTWREIPNMFPARNGGTGVTEAPSAAEAPPLLAVVNNELYAADHAAKEVRKYDKVWNSWSTVGSLPERAMSTNGWGIAFRGCGERIVVIGGPRALAGGTIELNSWVPSEGPPQWKLLARRKPSGTFVYNCAVMGC